MIRSRVTLRSALAAAPAALALVHLPGCLWIPATVAVLVATSGDNGGSSGPKPVVVPPAVLEGPFLPLEGLLTDVLVADILPDEDDNLDVAVLSRTTLAVMILRGDGTGSFPEQVSVPLSPNAGIPLSLATVSLDGTSTDLLVATSDTLECIRWNEAARDLEAVAPLPLCQEFGLRDIAVADFNGNGTLDAAVSCKKWNQVEVFLDLEILDGVLTSGGQDKPSISVPAREPRALAAADFDLNGYSDLAALELERNAPVIRLYLYLSRNASFTQVDELSIPDLVMDEGAVLEASDDVFFGEDPGEKEDREPVPDLLAARRRLPVKILVDHTASGPRLRRSTSPTGPSSLQTLDAALIRLPRHPPKPELWDVAAADATRKAVVVGYSGDDGIGRAAGDLEDARIYPLPGVVQALAVGDLNGDGQEDIVATSSNPAGLLVLLANAPAPEVEKAPFHYPFAGFIGEEQPMVVNVQEIVHGGVGSLMPFLAAQGLGEGEILVIPLEKLKDFDLRDAEKLQFPERIRDLAAADVDQLHGDDIIATGGEGRISVFLAGPAGFSSGKRLDLSLAPALPVDLSSRVLRTRSCYPALLDENDDPDLIIPLHIDAPGDPPELDPDMGQNERTVWQGPLYFVAVILNPGTGNPVFRFFRTLEEPRRAVVANLNGDRALDLIVASEGENKVHLLFGNPEAPGSFFAAPDHELAFPPRGYIAPVVLPGIEEEGEIEFVWTDNQAMGFGTPARFIVTGGGGVVGVYCVVPGEGPGAPPAFDGPFLVYEGFDPESVVLFDVVGDDVLDLLISDEDLGEIVVLESRGDAAEGDCSPWEEKPLARLPIDAAAGDIAVFRHGHGEDDEIVIATGTDTTAGVEIYKKRVHADCGNDCSFIRQVPGLLLAPEPRRSGPAGLAAARNKDGRLFVASLVEDAEPGTGAVDLVSFPPGASLEELRSFLAPGSSSSITRLAWPGEEIDGVLLGRFSNGDGPLDLLVHTASGELLLHPGVDPGAEMVPEPEDIAFPPLDGLLQLERVEMSSGPDSFLAITNTEACLMDADGNRTVIRSSSGGKLTSVAHGWSTSASRDLSNLSIALLDAGQLLVLAVPPGQSTKSPIAKNVSGVVGCRDLDGDGADDVVLAAAEGTSVSVYLAGTAGAFKEPPVVIPLENRGPPVDMIFLDANGDGRTDICIGTLQGYVHLLLGNGRGEFPDESASVAFAGDGLEAVHAVDLDGDGREDVLASVAAPGLVILRSKSKP